MQSEELYQAFLQSRGISTDTRTLQAGDIFFALKGPNFDANEKAGEALSKGAILAIIDNPVSKINEQCIVVDDVLQSLQDLASLHRSTMQFPVFGITGSNGKTTTKEILLKVLDHKFKVFGTQGNFNNHIGVPLTILATPGDCNFLIVEMGSNQPGDIELLCKIARPDYGLITNIGLTHLEKLKNKEGVFVEKKSLFSSIVDSNGTFFLNDEDPFLRKLKSKNVKIVNYTIRGFDEVAIKDVTTQAGKLCFTLDWNRSNEVIQTHMTGSLNIQNISAALCVGLHFNVRIDLAIEAIESYKPANMRSQLVITDLNTIVMDSYNANPTSMKASLTDFIDLTSGDGVVIIGDMLELGDDSVEFHLDIIDFLEQFGDLRKIFVGEIFYHSCKGRAERYQNVNELKINLKKTPITNQHIFIKGSRGIKLEELLDML